MTTANAAGADQNLAAGDSQAHVALLLKFARLLAEAGLPAHRVEENVLQLAQRFGTPVEVFAVPTNVWLSFPRPDGPAAFMQRVHAGPVDLERLAQLSSVADDVIRGRATGNEANARIDAVCAVPPRWKPLAVVVAYIFSAIAFAAFFGGGTKELIVSSCVGLAAGAIAVGMQRTRTRNRLFELVAAAAAALVAGVADWVLGSYSDWIPLAAGLIILLPGIALVDAVEELAHGRLVAGGARMAGVGVVFLALTFGAVFGTAVAELLPDAPRVAAVAVLPDSMLNALSPPPYWCLAVAVVLVALGSTVRFRARPRHVFIIFTASAVALVASRTGAAVAERLAGQEAGPFAGAFVAALALGLVADLYAWIGRTSPELVLTPGLAVLVPGSFGVRSFEKLLTKATVEGINESFHMFLIAMALVAGLLFSSALVRDRAG
jgi:uncharacterized membrane protein YjjP (DUF1212 family)